VLNIFGRADGWAEYADAWAMPGSSYATGRFFHEIWLVHSTATVRPTIVFTNPE